MSAARRDFDGLTIFGLFLSALLALGIYDKLTPGSSALGKILSKFR